MLECHKMQNAGLRCPVYFVKYDQRHVEMPAGQGFTTMIIVLHGPLPAHAKEKGGATFLKSSHENV